MCCKDNLEFPHILCNQMGKVNCSKCSALKEFGVIYQVILAKVAELYNKYQQSYHSKKIFECMVMPGITYKEAEIIIMKTTQYQCARRSRILFFSARN